MEGIVMEFIPGRTVQESDFEDSDYLAIFAKFLKQLHQSKEPFPLACSPFQRFHNFLLKGEQKKLVYPLRFSEVKTLMEELEASFQLMPISLIPAHLDLHPLNIMIVEKRFLLVDWVNGGMSDPYFDLATFTIFQCLNESQILTFLTHYFGRHPTQLEWNRFIVTQPIRLFVIAAALLTLSTDTTLSLSYQEALESSELPTIKDFGKDGMNWPHWQFGLTMFKAGLNIIDQNNFKFAFKDLQKHAFQMAMNI
jgi:thiamine kinase-like enzyme